LRFETATINIEPLNSNHDRSAFECGNPSLDRYLREQAGQDVRRGVARVFVATIQDAPAVIQGYFTLSATSVSVAELPVGIARRLPRYPVPAALIGRLAVDRRSTGRGLGRVLVADALHKSRVVSQTMAVTILVVDPIDDTAEAFCRLFGFDPLAGVGKRMFLMLLPAAIPR
jgi:GNAT superfamily N-acetyltransferase